MEKPKSKNAHLWERDENDWYIEPAWCSARLFDVEKFDGSIFDPAAGVGGIVQSARNAGYAAGGIDLIQRRNNFGIKGGHNFFSTRLFSGTLFDNIVSNPPFGRIEEFSHLAVKAARFKVALLFPVRRVAHALWLRDLPLAHIYYLTPRPSMPPGRVVMRGIKPGSGQQDFAWLVFDKMHHGDITHAWLHRDE